MVQRVQKLLAASGIASRRACEALIASGRVSVNGTTVTELGAKADPETDDIRVDGRRIRSEVPLIYIALNKPTGVVTTVRDRHADRTVMDLVRGAGERIYPIGRLDAETAGLLLLTNDGDFAQALSHPSHRIAKTYRAVVRGLIDEFAVTDLRMGVMLDDGMATAEDVAIVEQRARDKLTVIDMTIRQGRNRQVRRMLQAVGCHVLALTRTSIGTLTLAGLAPGTWRKLRNAEVALLRQASLAVEEDRQQSPSSPSISAAGPTHVAPSSGRGRSRASIKALERQDAPERPGPASDEERDHAPER